MRKVLNLGMALSLTALCCLPFQAFAQLWVSRLEITDKSQVPKISAELALLKYNAGKVIVVDTTNPNHFKNSSHILGAINLSGDGREHLERLRNMKLPFPKTQEIIVYCK
jgi:hypothetical protein